MVLIWILWQNVGGKYKPRKGTVQDILAQLICEGVSIEDEVFIGHGVMSINDHYPRATTEYGELKKASDWTLASSTVRQRASIGSNATILGGVTVGKNSIIGAGAVVTQDVPDHAIAVGAPARVIGDVRERDIE